VDSPSNIQSYFQLVSTFNGNVVANWTESTGGSGIVHSIDNTNLDDVKETDGKAAYGYTGPNTFTFKRAATFTNVAPNAPFRLGQLVYHNGTIYSGTGATHLSLRLGITLTNPNAGTADADIPMTLDNTPNTSSGAKSADNATFDNPVTNFNVTVDGVSYKLRVYFANIVSSEGYVSGNTVNVWEGMTGTVDVLGVFESVTPP
jgi:hypothetical protein